MSQHSTLPVPHGHNGAARQRRLIKYLAKPLVLEESGPPRVLLHFSFFICLLVGGFLAWAAITELQETAQTSGQIMPAGSVHVVQHLEGGIVSQILVEDGQIVQAGDTLVRLQPAIATADLEQLRAREAALALKAERLRAFVLGGTPDQSAGRGHPELAKDETAILQMQLAARDSERAVLLSRVEQREAELQSLRERKKSLEREVAILDEQVEMRRPLMERNLLARTTFLDSERALTSTAGELSAVAGEIARTEAELNEAQHTIIEMEAKLSNEALKEMGNVAGELAEVRQQLAKLGDRVVRLEIKAPVQGIVKGLATRTVGGVVAPGDPIAEIVPIDDELVAEVRIQPRDVGHLKVGQEARVQVTTYDVARFGSVEGRLEQISASTFTDEEGNPFYRGIIALTQNYVGDRPGFNPILPGMVVDAAISTGSKSLIRYLLKPVYRSLDIAFSER